MLKKILSTCLVLTGLTVSAYATEFTSFNQITQGVSEGKNINIVVHDSLCKMIDPNKPHIPVSTMNLRNSSFVATDEFVSFSGEMFAPKNFFPLSLNTTNQNKDIKVLARPLVDLMQRGAGYIDNQGNAVLQITFFNAETGKRSKIYKDVRIECQLGLGIRAYQY